MKLPREQTEGLLVDSTATVPDDMDSGFGPSGGGGSQKLGGFDRFSEAWKVISACIFLHFLSFLFSHFDL